METADVLVAVEDIIERLIQRSHTRATDVDIIRFYMAELELAKQLGVIKDFDLSYDSSTGEIHIDIKRECEPQLRYVSFRIHK